MTRTWSGRGSVIQMKRWLFVTYSPDPKRPYLEASSRYRCFNRAEDLRAGGHAAAVVSQQRFMRQPPVDFDIYVFHRPWHTQDFEGLLTWLRRRGKRLLADYDAPVFSEPCRGPVDPPFRELPALGVPAERGFDRCLGLFETIFAASPNLAELIRQRSPEAAVHVVESGLGRSWREMADTLYPYCPEERTDICVGVGAEMELDLELLGRVLPPVLEDRNHLRLIVDSRTISSVPLPPKRVRERSYEASGHRALGGSHTLILPAVSHAWNETASPIRALEAAYMGCRVVASPLASFRKHRDGGVRIAETDEQWMEHLLRAGLEINESSRTNMRDHALKHGASEIHTRRMIEVCES